MLRHVTTSPDGRYVAYDALGKIWIKDLRSDDAPRRLTRGDAGFELAPAFSPDGRTIAYASWSDEEGGRIRTIGLNGRGAREVVTRRGHYTSPRWSPSGDRIVYRSVGGNSIRGTTFGERTGIYVVDAGGGEPRKVRDGGGEPSFDATGERIFLNQGSRLVSTDLRAATRSRTSRAMTSPTSACRPTASGWRSPSATTPTWRASPGRAGRSR
jgi:Tol biopolymer transport system component